MGCECWRRTTSGAPANTSRPHSPRLRHCSAAVSRHHLRQQRPVRVLQQKVRGGKFGRRSRVEYRTSAAMKTLYDLLGALPNDDADALRSAFRNAVKGSHPDIQPGDPDAGLKFRQIVRANEILRDPDQRAAYDHLLDLARVEQQAVTTHVIATRIYKLAFGLVGLAGGSVATIGAYLLLLHLSAGSLSPQNEFETAARGQVEMAALAHAAFREASEAKVSATRDDGALAPPDQITQRVVTTETITDNSATTI